ncbi:MAG: nucleotidyltransferase domain-containing protein [Lachnospiraceae bacterium]|nr:nucleotidyltransferase domain-containing protein [Lachnospiraceae bacterium]
MCNLVKIKNNKNKEIQVASIKADTLQQLIQIFSICNKIEKVYLFGSALEERCTEKSDIDIAIISSTSLGKLITDKGYKQFKHQLYNIGDNQEYDILYFKSLEQIQKSNDLVCKDIISKGSIIYERLE